MVTIPADLVPLAMSIAPTEGAGELADLLQVPLSTEGFFEEAQLKLRPMDFTQEGIFLAGMASYPKFTEESITHALAAAAWAITLLSLEGGMHLGGVIAYVNPDLCVGCLTCTRTCPFEIPQILAEEGGLVWEVWEAWLLLTPRCARVVALVLGNALPVQFN